MQSEHIPHIKPSGRSHYEVHELQTWSDDALIAYILYTMQRKGMTEYSTALIPGYLVRNTIAHRVGICCFGHSLVAIDMHTNGIVCLSRMESCYSNSRSVSTNLSMICLRILALRRSSPHPLVKQLANAIVLKSLRTTPLRSFLLCSTSCLSTTSNRWISIVNWLTWLVAYNYLIRNEQQPMPPKDLR